MILMNLAILCCMLIFHNNIESEATIIHEEERKHSSSENSYERRQNKGRFKSYSVQSYSKKFTKQQSKTNSEPAINLSFKPLGALEIDSWTHGQLEIDPEAFDDVIINVASSGLSYVPNIYQYVPDFQNPLSLFDGDELVRKSSEEGSPEESTYSSKKHTNNKDGSSENNESDENGDSEVKSKHDDESEKENDLSENPRTDEDHSKKNDHSSNHENSDEDNSAEEHDASDNESKQKGDSSEQKNNSDHDKKSEADKNEDDKHSKENSKQSKENSKQDETGTEIPIETVPQEGYVDKFVKYYSYAKPLAKAASLFIPGIGQYRGVMFGMEMADLAYQTASMYSSGDGWLSIGYFLGKEAFTRLGRRSEAILSPEIVKIFDESTPSVSLDAFLEAVKNTQYPPLSEENELVIKRRVGEITYKYFHDQENFQNEVERKKFLDLMVSCVKFIALREIIPSKKLSQI